ncbi:hypothetical protein ACM7EP_29730 [Pseudomonas aeruginosa]|uniref:hypothetical protein n=1 Tax=Pseudomonas aeruginosa TaxID=287 RepID=UPI0022EB26EB|nr:hypothetical protein [Pseudomonas aeruginosa]MDA3148914.1 hypothetical protein [Pseudomonas aeruginosa]MDY1310867.1 hypothetical protein [Pseudomonas aeruginosa]MDY1425760.1 hypothetical protein [Pseudomonas aeruginosa]MDY1456740.1 hypothetical protein [Pseudomonas aeruginosa]MDY1480623.1 hypothetical protein [Pseudomonas aeruginosa]
MIDIFLVCVGAVGVTGAVMIFSYHFGYEAGLKANCPLWQDPAKAALYGLGKPKKLEDECASDQGGKPLGCSDD